MLQTRGSIPSESGLRSLLHLSEHYRLKPFMTLFPFLQFLMRSLAFKFALKKPLGVTFEYLSCYADSHYIYLCVTGTFERRSLA